MKTLIIRGKKGQKMIPTYSKQTTDGVCRAYMTVTRYNRVRASEVAVPADHAGVRVSVKKKKEEEENVCAACLVYTNSSHRRIEGPPRRSSIYMKRAAASDDVTATEWATSLPVPARHCVRALLSWIKFVRILFFWVASIKNRWKFWIIVVFCTQRLKWTNFCINMWSDGWAQRSGLDGRASRTFRLWPLRSI